VRDWVSVSNSRSFLLLEEGDMAAIVIPGPSPLVYRRRRAVALLVFAGFVIALVTVVGRLGDGSLAVSGPSPAPVAQLVGSSVRARSTMVPPPAAAVSAWPAGAASPPSSASRTPRWS